MLLMEMMLKKTAIIGVAVTRVQKIEFTSFRVHLLTDRNEINLGFYLNVTRTERLKDASIAHVLKLGIFTLYEYLGHCLI